MQDVRKRWSQHREKTSSVISKAIQKYGKENFKFEVICICFDEDMNKFEIEYIKINKSMKPNGYNIIPGGTNNTSDEMRKIQSEANKNKVLSDFTKKKISEAGKLRVGPLNSFYGKTHSEERKQIMRENFYKRPHPWQDKHLSEEHKEKLSIIQAKIAKAVTQYDKDGNVVAHFSSIAQAGRAVGVDDIAISRACCGKSKSSMGYIWKYTQPHPM